MKIKRLVPTFLYAAVLTAAPEYSQRIWRTEDGLPQNRVRVLSQTPDGYLWVGTSEGLARFDGARFTVFDRSNTPALDDDGILTLRVTADGDLWIGTEGGGLVRYHAGAFRNFGAREGLTNGFVRSIYEDSHKTLWIGTDRGFFRRDGDRFLRLDNTPEVPHATVPSIAEDEHGRLEAVSPLGLLTVEAGRLIRTPNNGCETSDIRNLHQTSTGYLWTVRNAGGGRLKNGCVEPDPMMPNFPMRTLTEDHEGTFWIGTIGHGLFRMSGGHPSSPVALTGAPGATVNAIFEDIEHNLWVACEDGLLRLSLSSVNNVGKAEGLDDEDVLTVYAAPDGDLWLATLTGQLYSLSGSGASPGELKRQRLLGAPAGTQARTVFQDHSGAFWFGTFDGGVIRQTASGITVYSKKNGMRGNSVRQILEDRAGNLWFALENGVSKWDGVSFRNYYLEDGLSYPSVRCLLVDKRGDVLAGTDAGLNRIHNGEIVRNAEFAALAGEKIWSMYEDAAGTLWLGTRGGGLIRCKSGAMTRFTRDNGLISNTIFSILEDNSGHLWMSTSSGIASAVRRELDAGGGQNLHITPFGTADGIAGNQMNGGIQPAGARTASGDLWFAGARGAVHINPAGAPVRRLMPVLIEKIEADSRTFPMTSPVSIPPGHGRLQIDFTVCDLVSPQRIAFRYKLEGFDENWTPAVRTRSANYTNLPHGDYTFHVIAADPGAPASASEAVLSFSILPAFYQTPWFFALLFLASAAAVWGGFAFFAHQTRARYGLLLTERTRLAREMHDTVIQGCVGVATLLEAAAGYRRADRSEADKLVDQARLQVTKTLEEAREAVWDLRHPQPPESAINVLFDLAHELGDEHNIRIDARREGSGALDPDVDRTILLVGREALGNAVAHADPSRIAITVGYTPFDVRLEVDDDGVGFDVPRETPPESRHFGLTGMRERVEAAGGSFRIESKPGAGTKVCARIPTVRRFRDAAP